MDYGCWWREIADARDEDGIWVSLSLYSPSNKEAMSR